MNINDILLIYSNTCMSQGSLHHYQIYVTKFLIIDLRDAQNIFEHSRQTFLLYCVS